MLVVKGVKGTVTWTYGYEGLCGHAVKESFYG